MNSKIIDEFERLIKQIKFDIDNAKDKKEELIHSFRLSSISKVLKLIKSYPNKIKSSDDLKGIKGIGKNSLNRIDEIIKTGKLSEIKQEQIDQTYLNYLENLEEVFGIGRKTALELYKKYNVKSVKDLKKLHKNGIIQLPDNVLKGLKYYGKFKENIPRDEIDEINKYLQKKVKKVDDKMELLICGSYRRLKPTSNDIDILITHPKVKNEVSDKKHYLEDFIDELIKDKFIVDSLTEKTVKTKYMGLCKYNKNPMRRIDIRFISYESYPFAVLYFTGSKDFNKMMRQVAIDMDYTLNEYGLYDNKKHKHLKAKTEEDIFKLLNLEYVLPEYRI